MFSKHRIEALIDGIFAVAMTLLVIELKVPERASVHAPSDLAPAIVQLLPTFISWIISFFVLAIFWIRQQRLFHLVRVVNDTLAWIVIAYLSAVSLMPFSAALAGQYETMLASQVIYSLNMILLSAFALLMTRYVVRHPELTNGAPPDSFYRSVRFRVGGLMVIAVAAVGVAFVLPGSGNAAFLLMIPISIIGGRIEGE
jgi:uncharacterized membrane protein